MIKNYLLVALRNFRNNKVFSLINIFGLTLGIACSLAIFMIVRYELSFDTFHPNHKSIYRVVGEFRYPEGIEYTSGTPTPLPAAFKNDFPQLRTTIVYATNNNLITVPEEQAPTGGKRFKEDDGVFYTEPAFFDIFSFKWLQGDPHTILNQPNTVALTRSTAEKYFGDWQKAIGRTILKDNTELLTVQGILDDPPANTDFPFHAIISYATIAKSQATRGWGDVSSRFQTYVLLPEGLTAARFNTFWPAFRKKYINNKTDYYALQPLDDLHFNARLGNLGARTTSKETLWALSLIAVFLMILGCINFINLATAQAARRSKEVGIRKVLGSGRLQLAVQFLGETGLIVVMATILAIALVTVLSPMITVMFNGATSLKPIESPSALLFLGGIAILVTAIAGFYPAIVISGYRPIAALKNKIAAASGQAGGGLSLRRVLVTMQFVIAQALIIGVLVAISQMNFFRNSPLGFNKDAIITVNLPMDSASRTKWEPFRQQVLHQSGIAQVSLSFRTPASTGNSYTDFRYAQNIKNENFEINLKEADAAFPATYGLQLIAGHFCQPSDTIREIVVNETFLKKEGILDPLEVLGKYLYVDGSKAPIVGVVKDFHEHSLRDPIDPVAITTNLAHYRLAGIKLSTTNLPSTIKEVEQAFNSYFPEYIFEHKFLDETIAHFYDQEEKLSKSFKFFAAIALIISCLGLYGLILFTTTQRMKEVGIRKVLGASAGSISFLFIREFLLLTAVAFVIASPLAWYFMNKWLQNFTYRVPITAWMFVVTGASALLIGLLTIGFQTVRTAMANPVRSLRSE